MKSFSVLLALALISSSLLSPESAFARDPEPATITRFWQKTLFVSKMKKAEIVNAVQCKGSQSEWACKSTGKMLEIVYAQIKLTFDVLPYGCNVEFLKDELIASMAGYESTDLTETRNIVLGQTFTDPDGMSICPGVPPREVTMTLPLVNGVRSRSDKEAVYSYCLPAQDVKAQVCVETTVNQLTGKTSIKLPE